MSETLSILFSGICCSFHDIVPGVPMRAVLPGALAVRFGMVNVPDISLGPSDDQWVDYYLMPHVPFVTDKTTTVLLTGATLKVSNPVLPQSFSWDPGGYSLSQYVNNFEFSEDVVMNFNAACYFDVLYGNVTPIGTGLAARSTLVTIETDGPPVLEITPFPGSPRLLDQGGQPIGPSWTIASDNLLWVSNIDYDVSTDDRPFDFLLNYLVANGGIPKQLSQLTPGLTNPTSTPMDMVGAEVTKLGAFIASGGWVTTERLQELATRPVPLNESCSDSHVP